jgi:two-component system chemotaxis sensor kinase CheA
MIDLSLLEDFVTGAGESLDEMENALLELETEPNNTELLNTIFRAMHTIKGAAQFVGLEKVSALSHVLEDLLDLLRNGKKQATVEIVELLIQTKDRISSLVNDLEQSQTERTEVNDLVVKISVQLNLETPPIVTVPQTASAPLSLELDEDLSSFLSEQIEDETAIEDLSAFLSEESQDEDMSAFLSEQTEDEAESEDLASFLAEDNYEEDISSFLSESTEATDNQFSAFLSEDSQTGDEAQDLSSFLTEDSADEAFSVFSIQETQESVQATQEQAEEEFFAATKSELPEIPVSAVAKTAIEDEFVLPDEEYDQELFGIFVQQLQEKFSLLEDFIKQLAIAGNKNELLDGIIEALESLKFSANYMAYDKLTLLYSKWIDDVVDVQEELLATGQVSFGFMDHYMTRLRNIFPQLQESSIASKPVQLDKVDSILADSIDKLGATDDRVNADLAFINDFIQEENVSSIATLPLTSVTAEKAAEVWEQPLPTGRTDQQTDEEEGLFDRLSQALDSSIEQSITAEPINELFGALLATTKEQQSRDKAEKERELALEVKTLAQANSEPLPKPKVIETTVENKVIPTAEPKAKPIAEIKVKPSLATESDAALKKPKTESSTDKVFKKSIRVDADKIDSLMNQVGELIVDRAYFFQLANEINELQQYLKEVTGLGQKDLKPVRTFAYRFSEAIISLGRTSNELQEGVMKVRMLPIAQIFNRYPRLVHDLAHTNGKKVQLEIRGEETELDKMIIEEISDPLIHMIRNAIGHGIETPEVRKKAGKPETGTLILEAYHESNHIVIEVTDDGRGIDTERIKAKAEEMALFSKEELNRMSKDDLTRFIMMPGFSTAKEINSTSGRGVGMDVVKKNIEKLNGTIEVESKVGQETRIRLKIPLTLAIIPALLVRVGIDSFTIPLANVEETLRVSQNEITIMEETEVMYLRGKTLPIFRLAVLFGLKSDRKETDTDFFVVVVNTGNQRIGLMVDALLGQEEVVIKPLADYLHEQNCFSGATIIGDGRISLILDVYELINMTTDKQIKKHYEQEKKSLASLQNSF